LADKPTLCMIFEGIGPYSAIGRVAMQGVTLALDAGWKVTVVTKRLDESLVPRVEWLKMHVPPKFFYYQWITARKFIRQALGNRTFDVIHAHQPQVADLSDIFQCHFLTRAAYERKSLTRIRNLRSAFIRIQEQGVLHAEDNFYRTWNPNTRMMYDSGLTRDDFHRLYGKLKSENVMVYAFPKLHIPNEQERAAAKAKLVGTEHKGPVLGFLGGLHERKGYRALINGLEGDNSVFLLMGGQYSAGFQAPTLAGRFKAVGLVEDIKTFYHACDAFIVPSYYEPLGLVGFEAAANGVPVIATPEVGALPHLLEYGAGCAWNRTESLPTVVQNITAERKSCNAGAVRMEQDLGAKAYGERLIKEYYLIRDSKLKSRE